jgi:ParB-like chromosome segregation protein Spo0J
MSLTNLQRFVAVDIPRSQIKNAPYNPRTITSENRAKLEQSLREFGLVEPLVWNKRTGNLVGGHQRLSMLDQLSETGADYSVTVAAVDLDEDREKALNVILNAPQAQGRYEDAALAALVAEINSFDLGSFLGEAEKKTEAKLKKLKSKKITVDASFEIVVKCADEKDQREKFDYLTGLGYECRVLTL